MSNMKMTPADEKRMEGKIVKGIAGFYYVHNAESGLYECKAKGAFRNKKIKPLVGDMVLFEVIDDDNKKGNIIEIKERMNELIRPAVANIDQCCLIFAAAKPSPNLNLLDRFLVMMEKHDVETVICFNKQDVVNDEEIQKLKDIYENCGYRILFLSALYQENVDQVKTLMKDKTTVFAGPSGVGKSTLTNAIKPEANMETGAISEKIERGKHTTRHSEIFHVEGHTYMMDTPGFTSLSIEDVDKEDLGDYFIEFREHANQCRFIGCAHINEPGCAVKDALGLGKISESRYENYKQIYEELKNRKPVYRK